MKISWFKDTSTYVLGKAAVKTITYTLPTALTFNTMYIPVGVTGISEHSMILQIWGTSPTQIICTLKNLYDQGNATLKAAYFTVFGYSS